MGSVLLLFLVSGINEWHSSIHYLVPHQHFYHFTILSRVINY